MAMSSTTPTPTPPPSTRRRRIPTLAESLLATAALVLLVVGLIAAPGGRGPGTDVIGERELVRLSGPDGDTVEAVAIVDTGASSSSIDEDIAEELGFDLASADTVTVRSALGREERPVVNAGLQLAGRVMASRATVNDRSELDTEVLIGRRDLREFQVAVGRRLLTTPGEARTPSTIESLFAETPSLSALALLALLPLAALFIVLLRVVVGVTTLGTFSPVLLAFAYTQAGVTIGVLLTVFLLALGFVLQPLLRRMRQPRVARIGVIVGMVAVTLVAIQELAGVQGAADTWGTALPVVITAVIVERLWEAWDLDGAGAALKDAAVTLLVALLVTALIASPAVRSFAEDSPLILAVACTLLIWVAGTYRGLRASELVRFRPINPAKEIAS